MGRSQGRPLRVAWDDREIACIKAPCGRQGLIPGVGSDRVRVTEAVPNSLSGMEVTDYSTAFASYDLEVRNGTAELLIGTSPVFIEMR